MGVDGLHLVGASPIGQVPGNDESAAVFLAGQALPKEPSGRDTAGAGVVAVNREGDLLGQAIANAVGEFQMELVRTTGILIYIAIPGEDVIAISLTDSTEPIESQDG